MHTVKTSRQLLEPHISLIEKIRICAGIDDERWRALYEPLIERTARHLQHLPARSGDGPLLHTALESALEALQRSEAAGFERSPLRTRYAVFAAALVFDAVSPAADLEVTVTAANGTEMVWEPMETLTIAEIGSEYEMLWTERGLDPALARPIIAWSLLPRIARKWLCADREVAHEFLEVCASPKAKLAGYIPCYDRPNARPAQRLHEFTDYLQELILAGRFNRPESAIHVISEGLFLNARIFTDFDAADAREVHRQLLISPILVTQPDAARRRKSWRLPTADGHRVKGWIIDHQRARISVPSAVSSWVLSPPVSS